MSRFPLDRLQQASFLSALPPRISGLQFWGDAGRITGLSDGDSVTTWSDLSGNGNDATQATAAKKPLYKVNIINGRPVVRVDGTDDLLLANGIATLLTGTDVSSSLAIVVKVNTLPSVGVNPCFAGLGRSAAGAAEMRWSVLASAGPVYNYRATRTDDADASAAFLAGTPDTAAHILSVVFTGTQVSWFVDGSQVGVTTSLNVGALTVDRFSIGALVQGGTETLFLAGDIAELTVHNRALATPERQQIERYFGRKYAITVN